ncbi:hypothetical protein OAO87_00785 [bacterium]|nr:hypothetical protein [bacterium]
MAASTAAMPGLLRADGTPFPSWMRAHHDLGSLKGCEAREALRRARSSTVGGWPADGRLSRLRQGRALWLTCRGDNFAELGRAAADAAGHALFLLGGERQVSDATRAAVVPGGGACTRRRAVE